MSTETEFNGSIETADIITIETAISGNLFDASDVDFFALQNLGVGTLSIQFDSPTFANTYDTFVLQVLNSAGDIIYGESAGADVSFDFVVKEAGDYFLSVAPDYHNSEEYSLIVLQSTETESQYSLTEVENNNTAENATIVTSSAAQTGQLYSGDDEDFYSFEAQRADKVSISFEAPPDGALTYDSFVVELFDSALNLLNKKETSDTVTFDTQLGETGTFFVKISSSYPYEDGMYSLSIDAPYNASPAISMPFKYYYGLQGENLTASLAGISYSDPEGDPWSYTALRLVSSEAEEQQILANFDGENLSYDTWITFLNSDVPSISYSRPDSFSINKIQASAWDGFSWSNVMETFLVSVADVISGDSSDDEIITTVGVRDSYVFDGKEGYDKLVLTFTDSDINTEIHYAFSESEDFNDREIYILNFEEVTYNLNKFGWNFYAQDDLVEHINFGNDDDTVVALIDGDTYQGAGGYNFYRPKNQEQPVTYNSETGTVTSDQGTDVVVNFMVYGTDENDTYIGRDRSKPEIYEWFTKYIDQSNFAYDVIDIFAPLGGDNILTGGSGMDAVWYFGNSTGVSVDLGANTASHSEGNIDALTNIEMIIATEHDDILIGDDNDNFFLLYQGNDTVNGGGGSDVVSFGNFGVDVSLEAEIARAIDTNQSEEYGEQKLISVENIVGSEVNDRITGDAKANFLAGDGGNDQIDGGSGDDYIFGGEGNDTLTGGTGNDHFVFYFTENLFGTDIITDFVAREDTLDVSGFEGENIIYTLNSTGDSHVKLDAQNDIIIKSDLDDNTTLKLNNLSGESLEFINDEAASTLLVNSVGELEARDLVFDTVRLSGVTDFDLQLKSETQNEKPVSISDVILQLKHIVGLDILSGNSKAAADVDNDGSVVVSDVIATLKHIVGLEQINSFDLVTQHGLTINALSLESAGNLSLIANGDVDQSHYNFVI